MKRIRYYLLFGRGNLATRMATLSPGDGTGFC
jgi:hypothetical protein